MNIVRKQVTETTHVDKIPTVDTVAEALALKAHKAKGGFKSKAEGDAAVGLIEAFFVGYLRNSAENNLARDIKSLQAQFGADYNPLNRAIGRVKEFRGNNAAFRRNTW